MLRRLYRLNSTGKGVVMTYPTGPSYPYYGTVLSIACGTSQGQGYSQDGNDALGTTFSLSIEKWVEIADGSGGSIWQDSYNSNTTPCFYPYGYVYNGFVNTTLNWSAPNGNNGTFVWGEHWDVNYYDGNGGTLHEDGIYNAYSYGYVISNDDASGYVVNLQNGNWAFWYVFGYFLGTGSDQTFVSPCGGSESWYIGDTIYDRFADGNGGEYHSYMGYYNWLSYGTYIGNCGDYNWYSDGGGGYYQGEFTGGNGCPSYGTYISGGNSGNYTISTSCGDMIVGNWYDDVDYADGNCGYYNDGTSYNNYLSNGTQIGDCDGQYYYSDGYGGYYTQSDNTGGGGGECPSYGTYESSGSYNLTYQISNVTVNIGTYNYDNFADGNCGSFQQGNPSYYSYGEELWQETVLDPNSGYSFILHWHSDGNGGVYATL
jgi:hypothetical protein